MIFIVRRKKPHVELIKSLRESINYSQTALLAEMKKEGYAIARSTYQKIEKGELTQMMYFENLIKFYTKILPTNHIHKEIQIEDLILDPNRINVGNIKQHIQNANVNMVKKYKKEIKAKENELVTTSQENEQIILHKMLSFEDIIKNISISSKRKFFYKINTFSLENEEGITATQCIQAIVRQIDEFKKKKIQSGNDNFGSETDEFKRLKEITHFSDMITLLRDWGISLYAGLLYLPQYSWKEAIDHPENNHYVRKVTKEIYTIFCFRNDLSKDLIFHYLNVWPENKLNHFLKNKKNKFKFNELDESQLQQANLDVKLFEDNIKYFSGIDESSVSFDHQLSGFDVDYASKLGDEAYGEYEKLMREEDID